MASALAWCITRPAWSGQASFSAFPRRFSPPAASDTEEPATDLEASRLARAAVHGRDHDRAAEPALHGDLARLLHVHAITTDLDGDGCSIRDGTTRRTSCRTVPSRRRCTSVMGTATSTTRESAFRAASRTRSCGKWRWPTSTEPGGSAYPARRLRHATGPTSSGSSTRRARSRTSSCAPGGRPRSRAGAVHAGDYRRRRGHRSRGGGLGREPESGQLHAGLPVTLRLRERRARQLQRGRGASRAEGLERDGHRRRGHRRRLRSRSCSRTVMVNRVSLPMTAGARNGRDARSRFRGSAGPSRFNAELCDIDGDGDLDLLYDSAGPGLAPFLAGLVNDGSGALPRRHRGPQSSAGAQRRQSARCADIDNDGDYDLVVASLSNRRAPRNDGTGHFTNVNGIFPRGGSPRSR